MKFDESSLNEYLVKNLGSLTDANPVFLADYIVALLKKDKPLQELRKLCVDNLVEFLGHGTKSFVSELFKTFEDGSIMTSDGTADRTADSTVKVEPVLPTLGLARQNSSSREENPSISREFSDSEEKEVSDDEDDDRNHKHRRRENRPQPLEDSQGQFSRSSFRKRNRPNENGQQFVERRPVPMDFGQKSRMGRGVRPSNSSQFDLSSTLMRPPIGGRGRCMNSWDSVDTLGFAPQMPSLLGAGFSTAASTQSTSWGSYGFIPSMSNGCLDPLHPLNLQGALPSMNPVSVGMPRQRCRDFEERGFCLRGDMCPMEHGMNRIVVEDVQSLSQFNLPVSLPTTSILGSQTTVGPLPTAPSSNFLSNNKSAASRNSKSGTTNTGLRIDVASSAPTLGPESDVYDPDQPLWNNNLPLPETSGSGLRLPSPSMDDVGALWESGLSDPSNLSSGMGNELQNLSTGDLNMESLAPWGGGRSSTNLGSMRKTLGNGVKKEADSIASSVASIDKTVNVTDFDGGHKLGKTSQRAQKSLFVCGIPQSNNRREALISHFHKFGQIIDIRIPLNSDIAFVQFSKREEAEAALKSPDAVMGNRFIRLFWANRDNIPDGVVMAQSSPASNKLQAFIRDKGEDKDSSASQNTSTGAQKTPIIGMQKAHIETLKEELQKKQDSLKQKRDESSKAQGKMENIESLREELRKKQESLKQKRDEFMRQLQKLQKQTSSTAKSEVVTEQPSKKPKTGEFSEVTNAPIVEEHQEHEKTREKGSSRETIISPNSKFSVTPILPLARSGKLASHSAGFYANRFKIDNRPTGFRILSPLPDDLANIDTLKEHFSTFGELSGIELDTSTPQPSALINFTMRSSAEKGFSAGNSWKGHNLQFLWLAPQSNSKFVGVISATKASKATSSSTSSEKPQNSAVANGVESNVASAEKIDSLVLVSLSRPLSTAECGDKASPSHVLDDEGSRRVDLA